MHGSGIFKSLKEIWLRFSTKKWDVEDIPISDHLYRKIHYNSISNSGEITPAGFDQPTKDLSCDWSKYATPQSIKDRIGKELKTNSTKFKDPTDFFICMIIVGDALSVQDVIKLLHTPVQHRPEEIGKPNNRAHSDLICAMMIEKEHSKKEKARVKARALLAKASTLIDFDEPVWAQKVKNRTQ